jgi:acyl-CoA hydrolase/N-acetylglutamate synthase-like GNAT family acetyltransferase
MISKRLRESYDSKLVSADEAVKIIRSGDRVYIGSNCGQPVKLSEALVSRRNDLYGVEIVHLLTMGPAEYVDMQYEENFRHLAYFLGGNVRKAAAEGHIDYAPIFLSEIPELFKSGQTPLDVCLIAVSPPDEHGYCSMGVSVDIGLAAARKARHLIIEVNKQMPRTLGQGFIHIDDATAIIEADYPVLEHGTGASDDVSRQIAQYIVDLVEDGATVQTGIGRVPSAVLEGLTEKNDLGVHTETFSDALIEVIENGNVTCRKKSLHPNKVISTFVIGSKRLYDFIDNNPFFEMHPTEYVNDPFVIGQNNSMVAINGAIEVDLTGQVVSDSIGSRPYSGIGGQVDFIRGASRSKGGRPIITLPSTAAKGTVSRIVPTIKPGAGVVTSRGDVHYVITEYGVAYLHGKSIRERAISLIGIAHPDFRDELLEKAKDMGIVPKEQPSVSRTDPETLPVQKVELETGEEVTLRPIRPSDEQLLRQHFYSLSPESVFHRFHRMVQMLPKQQVRELVNVDYTTHMALVATVKEGKGEKILGTTRFYVDEKTRSAEIAFAILDEWQNKGIGRMLLDRMIERARELRVKEFIGYVQTDNTAMLKLLQTCGYPIDMQHDDGVYRVRVDLTQDPERPKVEA